LNPFFLGFCNLMKAETITDLLPPIDPVPSTVPCVCSVLSKSTMHERNQ
jgi:hypothetical protein